MTGKLIIAVWIILYSWLHPVHVSLLNIDLDAKTGKIEIAFKIIQMISSKSFSTNMMSIWI